MHSMTRRLGKGYAQTLKNNDEETGEKKNLPNSYFESGYV